VARTPAKSGIQDSVALEQYNRKRQFDSTPEPSGKVERSSHYRFVVQKHHASRLHYDFRLEMEGVLKSWAVPKGPSLDPAHKRLAMQVEDHPVSYFDFEGTIPEDNYGAGTVMVWDIGTWEPLGDPVEMLEKGDLKFRLQGTKLKGEFVLAKMRSSRPGSKGTEWLLIKKKDEFAEPGFDANLDKLDYSALTDRSLDEIAGDQNSAEWQSNRKASAQKGAAWLSVAPAKKRPVQKERAAKQSATNTGSAKTSAKKPTARRASAKKKDQTPSTELNEAHDAQPRSIASQLEALAGAHRGPMPAAIHPMLATLVEEPFDDDQWLFEVKWDGYRAVTFIKNGEARLVSRNQNQLTGEFPEIAKVVGELKAENAILDGEVVALNEKGLSSFSLMQQRTGITHPGKSTRRDASIPIVYYVFDLLYLNGYNLMKVGLEQRKNLLRQIIPQEKGLLRFSDHYPSEGKALFTVARDKGLEGIVAKLQTGQYTQKRSREWLKIKITRRQECVICGFTDPRGAREHFGSIILGLYGTRQKLIHVGQAGSGFTAASHADLWKRLQKLQTSENPFGQKIDSTRRPHWVEPKLVAEIKFSDWTHEGHSGQIKMRAPIYQGLRADKKPEECLFEFPQPTQEQVKKAEEGSAA